MVLFLVDYNITNDLLLGWMHFLRKFWCGSGESNCPSANCWVKRNSGSYICDIYHMYIITNLEAICFTSVEFDMKLQNILPSVCLVCPWLLSQFLFMGVSKLPRINNVLQSLNEELEVKYCNCCSDSHRFLFQIQFTSIHKILL